MAENAKKVSSASSEQVVRAIRRQTRRKFSANEKIRIVLDGLRGEGSIADVGKPAAEKTLRGSEGYDAYADHPPLLRQ